MNYLHDIVAHIQSNNKVHLWPIGYKEIFILGDVVILGAREYDGGVYFEDFSNHNRIYHDIRLDTNLVMI